jgi:nucleoside 2-deoxyribosyltransferase
MKRIYIAGPMRGYKHYNFPAFDAAAERLRRLGFEPVSPADADRALGFDPMTLPDDHDWNTIPDMPAGFAMRDIVKRCCDAVISCDGMLMLDGFEMSAGAMAERELAFWMKLPIAYAVGDDDAVKRKLQC